MKELAVHGTRRRAGQLRRDASGPSETAARKAVVAACLEMNRLGLNQGSSGNISVRFGADMLISPSTIPYEAMTPRMIARVPLTSNGADWPGPYKPSSEWRLHRDILLARPEVGAVVHCHAPYAAALSMLRERLPPAHYMIAAFGGGDVRCTPYCPFGGQRLSDATVEALSDRFAALLGNHGAVTVGADLRLAMWRAHELETLARMYMIARAAGEPVLLSEDEISDAVERFAAYSAARFSFDDQAGADKSQARGAARRKR